MVSKNRQIFIVLKYKEKQIPNTMITENKGNIQGIEHFVISL